jgi:hypothetical protein
VSPTIASAAGYNSDTATQLWTVNDTALSDGTNLTQSWTGSVAGVTQLRVAFNSSYDDTGPFAYSGSALIKSLSVTGTGANPFGGAASGHTLLGVFHSPPNKRNTYYWLSYKDVSGTNYVFFNGTSDNFATVTQTQIARYINTMHYGLTTALNNYRTVYASAGSPASGDAFIYKSTDGGKTFAATAAALNTRGGALWWNYSGQTANVRNTSESNLLWLKGLSGSNQVQVVKGISGSAVTIVTDATRYAETHHALIALNKDLDYVKYLARTGHFYRSTNAGSSWTAGTTVTGGASAICRGLTGWPTDSNFAWVYGYRILAYTEDAGVSVTNEWTDYDTWRNSTYGASTAETILMVLPDLSVKYPVPVTT